MDLERVDKKLREARFFFDKMIDLERNAFGDKEPFDFYLSAFLNAAMTVHWRLMHQHKATYKPWRKKWNKTLKPEENRLIEYMVDSRNLEVHEGGSGRSVKDEKINIPGAYSDPSGSTVTVSSPPLVLGVEPQQPFVVKPAYYFTFDGVERKATEACGEYLLLLQRMVEKFKADHP
jgi:hypothetical protein